MLADLYTTSPDGKYGFLIILFGYCNRMSTLWLSIIYHLKYFVHNFSFLRITALPHPTLNLILTVLNISLHFLTSLLMKLNALYKPEVINIIILYDSLYAICYSVET